MRHSDARRSAVQETTALTQLSSLLHQLHTALPQHSVKEHRRLLQCERELRLLNKRGRDVMREVFGFTLEVCPSQLAGAGRGVVVTEGRVPSGHLVGLYPGMHINTCICNCVVILGEPCWDIALLYCVGLITYGMYTCMSVLVPHHQNQLPSREVKGLS